MNGKNETEYKKIGIIDSMIEAQLIGSILEDRKIPHMIRSYHDTAYDGLYQVQKGWGEIRSPADWETQILDIIEEIRFENIDETEMESQAMGNEIENDTWVYVVVQNPEGDENLLGLKDEENDADFLPAFLTKDAAEDNFLNIPREKGKKYEIQAIIFEDLAKHAKENGFMIFILDGDGKAIRKIEA